MLTTLVASVFLLNTPAAPDLETYEKAAVEAGRDPDANVRLALWCEAHGLKAEKFKHLALAVLRDPTHATARGLLGLIADRGKWRRPEEIGQALKADEARAAALAEYNARREALKNTAEAHWKLALWCEQNGLDAEATAHQTAVVRIDPRREAAWKRLGYRKEKGRWVTSAQLAAEKAERETQKRANKHWQPRMTKWRDQFGDPRKRAEAEREMTAVVDPRALPAIWSVFAGGSEPLQRAAVGLLGQIDSGAASRALAVLAVSSASAEVRRVAIEILKRRDPRDYLGLLIGMVRAPIKYQVKPVNGPGSVGVLFVEGKRFNLQRNYVVPALDLSRLSRLYDPSVPFDPFSSANMNKTLLGMAGITPRVAGRPDSIEARQANALQERAAARDTEIALDLINAQQASTLAQRQLAGDVAALDAANDRIRRTNRSVLPMLNELTGEDFGEDPDGWQKWWIDQQGYAYSPPELDSPTIQQVATFPIAYAQLPISAGHPNGHSCFGAGTPVRTLDGPRPIETIRLGDRLLTQDTTTGALSYQPVVAVFHNRPAQTHRIHCGTDTIVATGIHRFWKAGAGWTMARDLKPGDAIRTVGGTARVESVETLRVEPVFNLEVATGRSFFVGDQGVLVHDNTLVETVDKPFDAAPTLESVGASAR